MKNKNLVAIAFVFISTCMNAQTFFKPGYVIKSIGDTLFGEVDYRGDNRMTKVCTFRHNAIDSVRHFSPDEITGYRFPESKYYISKEVAGKKVFLEFLIKGKINVYYLKDNVNNNHYYIEKDSIGLIEIPYQEGIRVKDGKKYEYASNLHNGLLSYYMQDAKGLQPEIARIKKPDHDNLIALAKDYHNAVCTDEQCIIYEKKLPPFRVGLEVVGGLVSIDNDVLENVFIDKVILGNPNITQAGILAHFWLPRVNENLFLKTGLLLYSTDNKGQRLSQPEIPLQIEYVYPHGFIRPKFAIGMTFPMGTYDITPGVNIALTHKLFLTLSFNAGFNHIPYILIKEDDTRVVTSSISAGLYLNL